MIVALGSAKGSPGVTTTAVALAVAWPASSPVSSPVSSSGAPPPAVVEADPDGGSLAARYGLGVEPGLTTLAVAARREVEALDLLHHAQPVLGAVPVVPGPASSEQVHAALRTGVHLRRAVRSTDRDVLLDCGRLGPSSPSLELSSCADVLVLVARPRLDELQHVVHRGAALAGPDRPPVVLALVGSRPYSLQEVGDAVEVPVVGSLPVDPPAVAALGAERAPDPDRCALVRSAGLLAETLSTHLEHHGGRSAGAPRAGDSGAEGAGSELETAT